MVAAGGAATGVGAVLLLAGLGLIPRWVAATHDYENFIAPCTTTCPGEGDKWKQFTRARGTVLGLVIGGVALAGAGIAVTVIGTRKRTGPATRTSLAPGELRIRF